MTSTKESAEVAISPAASESSQVKNRSKPESAHLRADAVSLDVPVKAHGSLLPSVSPGAGPGGIGQAQPFEEQTSTMIVFPQGGVLKMSTSVSAGQVMVLTNLKSRQDAICRVVKVRAYGNGQSYVEIEFTSAQPGYWGVYFPSDGPEVARVTPQESAAAPVASAQDSPALSAPPVPQSAAPSIERRIAESPRPPATTATPAAKSPEPAPINSEVRPSPVVPPRRPVAPKLPESPFASIGTKEEVLAPADATRDQQTSFFGDGGAKRVPGADKDISDAIDALIAPPAKTIVSSRTESHESAATETSAARPFEPQIAAAETRPLVPRQMFGVMLDSAAPAAEKSSGEGGGKLWIGIGVAALIAIAAGAAYYFGFRPSLNGMLSSSGVTVVSTPAAQPPNAQPQATQAMDPNAGAGQPAPDQSASQSAALQSPDVASTRSAANDTTSELSSDAADPWSKPRDLGRSKQAPSVKPQPGVAIPSTAAALKARPIVARHKALDSAGAAPALNASAGPIEPTGSLPAIAPPPPSAPEAPKPVPNAPVRVGGRILPPRLVSSVLPIYPQIAQQAGVTGTVIIDTTIDKQGNVAKTRVISGPELLRQAALSALRQWKYEPSKLDGQPISVEMIVSIQFH